MASRYEQYGPMDSQPSVAGERGWIGVNMRLDPHNLPAGFVSRAINCRFNRGVIETRKGTVFQSWFNRNISVRGTVTRTLSVATFTTLSSALHGYDVGQEVTIAGFNDAAYNGGVIVTATGGGGTTFTYTVVGTPPTPDPNTGVAVGEGIRPWTVINGVGQYRDPHTHQTYLIVAADGKTYFSRPNNVPVEIALPSGDTIASTDIVRFTQAYDVLIMHRGVEKAPFVLKTIQTTWRYITQLEVTTPPLGTDIIPNADRSLFFNNRLFIPHGRDKVAFSDFNDYTRYYTFFQELKVNQGDADSIVRLFKFNETTIIAFKSKSIYAISNVFGDMSQARLDLITDHFGLAAADSVAMVGKDLWFLSHLGVMSLTQTEQNKIQGVVLPVSDAIKPLIDRLNWQYASQSWAAYVDSRYYLAVPLDDAEVFEDELVASLHTFGTTLVIPTVSGATYRWTKGATDTSLTNGASTYTFSRDFVASGSSVTITKTSGQPSSSSLKRIYKGANNAILVYDFLNRAWAGHDEADNLMATELFVFPVNGREQLFIRGADGYIKLYESSYEDQLSVPYANVTLTDEPTDGDTIQVNKGTLVTANAASTLNTPTTFGINGGLSQDRDNLWIDDVGTPGYYPSAGWTAPNTRPLKITNGVRFYGINGLLPRVDLDVDVSTDWKVVSVTTIPIVTTIETRFYTNDSLDWLQANWITVDLQTWSPSCSIDMITEGASEEFELVSDRTKDRTQWYRPFDKAPFDTTNTGGQFMDKYRQDYSLLLGDDGADEIALYATSGGVQMDLHQDSRERFRVNTAGRSAMLRTVNSDGRIRLMRVEVESSVERDRVGVTA